MDITIRMAYVVLTYILELSFSYRAFDSASLFFKSFPNPTSKKLTHPINKLSVSHIPHRFLFTNLMVKGTRIRVIRILIALSPNKMKIFFLAKIVLLCPELKNDFNINLTLTSIIING